MELKQEQIKIKILKHIKRNKIKETSHRIPLVKSKIWCIKIHCSKTKV